MKQKTTLFFFLILVPALAIVYYVADARYVSFLPRCPFNYFTGLLCPGCGSQRAISALLHGQVGQAFHFNALLVASLPLLIYSGSVSVINQFAHKTIQQPVFYSNYFTWFVFVLVLMFWVLRNLPFYPFTCLAPVN